MQDTSENERCQTTTTKMTTKSKTEIMTMKKKKKKEPGPVERKYPGVALHTVYEHVGQLKADPSSASRWCKINSSAPSVKLIHTVK